MAATTRVTLACWAENCGRVHTTTGTRRSLLTAQHAARLAGWRLTSGGGQVCPRHAAARAPYPRGTAYSVIQLTLKCDTARCGARFARFERFSGDVAELRASAHAECWARIDGADACPDHAR